MAELLNNCATRMSPGAGKKVTVSLFKINIVDEHRVNSNVDNVTCQVLTEVELWIVVMGCDSPTSGDLLVERPIPSLR